MSHLAHPLSITLMGWKRFRKADPSWSLTDQDSPKRSDQNYNSAIELALEVHFCCLDSFNLFLLQHQEDLSQGDDGQECQ